ncbi:hypothetical protein [Streptomyces solincola]|uniref:hypothetical protein n=1 Tax=Streptomyces solincola TaxID=2100817 RepID=UPI0021593C2C|nr:hypothetical protein [Streptomyces solincola]
MRKTLTAAAVVAATLAGVAACGTVEQLSAGQKLDRAFDRLGKEKSLAVEIDLDTDAASLKALDDKSREDKGAAGSADEWSGEQEPMPREAAELLSDAKISFSVHSDKPLQDSGEGDITGATFKVSVPDGDVVEFRMVGDTGYVRTDLDALGDAFGAPLPEASDLPPEAGAFRTLLDGGWVRFDTKELEKAAGDTPAGEPSPEPSLDAKTQKKLVEAVKGVLSDRVDFTTADSTDGEEHIIAVAPFRTLVGDLIDEIRTFEKQLPPGSELPTAKEIKELPDEKVSADFALKNGELTEVRLDLAKLAETAKVKKLGLVVRFAEAAEPTAPSGAVEFDPDDLAGAFGGPQPSGADFQDGDLGEDGLAEGGGGSGEGGFAVDPV